jgi:hypothetical protein
MGKTVGQEGDRNTAKTRRRSRGKARRSHHEVACVLGEVRGGSEWPDFAGILTGTWLSEEEDGTRGGVSSVKKKQRRREGAIWR